MSTTITIVIDASGETAHLHISQGGQTAADQTGPVEKIQQLVDQALQGGAGDQSQDSDQDQDQDPDQDPDGDAAQDSGGGEGQGSGAIPSAAEMWQQEASKRQKGAGR